MDRGGQYLSDNFMELFKSEGMLCELMTAYTPSQNGVLQNKNWTLFEKTHAIVSDARTPPFL